MNDRVATALQWIVGGFILMSSTALLGQAPSSPAAAPQLPQLTVREEPIAEAALGTKLLRARMAGNHLAWIEEKGDAIALKLDGKAVGGVYDDLGSLDVSLDGRLAITAKRNSKWFLVIDGQERPTPYDKVTAVDLSDDGKSYVLGACVGKKWRLLLDGEETGPEFQEIRQAEVSNGSHYSFLGKRDGKWTLYLDGAPQGKPMDAIIAWSAMPGGRIALAALVSNKWAWVIDGVPGPGFDVISAPVVSRDGAHVAYAGANSSKSFMKTKTKGSIVEDGKVIAEYEGRGFGGLMNNSIYNSNPTVMVTGINTMTADFHGVSNPQYTDDGRLVYAARRGEDKVAVFVDGKPGPDFEDIVSDSIGISADGRHTAYFAKRGDDFIEVRDHQPGVGFLGKRSSSWVELLTMDSTGEHVASEIVRCGKSEGQRETFKAILGRTGRCLRRVVIDGQGEAEYDARDIADFSLSADGRTHAYAVIDIKDDKDDRDNHSLVVFNGRETKPYDSIFLHSLEVVDDCTVTFVAYDGQRFIRVTATTTAAGR